MPGDEGAPDFCYLTTTGRHIGEPHEIEIWFALHEGTVYLLSGGGNRSDWVRNVMVSPTVTVRIGDRKRLTKARIVKESEEDALARRLLLEKYQPRDSGDLTSWAATALPVAVAWPE
ncbi:MAG TPA: nitroreductase family deazaflavin-dependent oxidoreductase [Actinomycetota bacterium]|nr:nitroreductase family deazaflavin-dependent oxidoreductase [Actinomycetota bacterium]